MRAKCTAVIGWVAMLAMGVAAQVSIIDDDFSSGSVSKGFSRFQDTDIDMGWRAALSAYWGYTSAWSIASGQLLNDGTNNSAAFPEYIPGEEPVVQVVSYSGDALPYIEISFDYDVAAGDTLCVHLWGLDGSFDGDGDWFLNLEVGKGGIGDETDNAGGNDDGVVAYSLKDGISAPELGAHSGQALVNLTGSGTYSNTITIASLGIAGINDSADFGYYLLAFGKVEDGLAGSTSVENVKVSATSTTTAPASPLKENILFPDQHVLASQQLTTAAAAGFNYSGTVGGQDAIIGQSFEFSSAQTLRAITFQKDQALLVPSAGTHEIEIWIGEYDSKTDPANHSYGATLYSEVLDVAGETFADGSWYTVNLDSDVSLSANTEYAFQLTWTTEDPAHLFHMKRYFEGVGGTDVYTDGTIVYQQGVMGAIPATSLINEPENDLVFALHSGVVGTEPSAIVEPSEIAMMLYEPATMVTGSVDFAFLSDTNVDIALSITDQSHTGGYSALTATPQTLSGASPIVHELAFQYDNDVGGAVAGAVATGLVNIAWNEVGSAVTNYIYIPISTQIGISPGTLNTWSGSAGTMDYENAANWSLGWVPGTLGQDRALIQHGGTVNVNTNPPSTFRHDLEVQFNTAAGSVLNIAADMPSLKNLKAGTLTTWPGFINQSAGTVDTSEGVIVGAIVNTGAAPTNSIYTMSGGALNVEGEGALALTIGSTGIFKLEDGTLTVDANGNAGAQAANTINAGGVLEISGGAYVQATGRANNDGIVRIIGDGASIIMKELWLDCTGTYEFILDDTGVSTIVNPSWGHLSACDFVVDGADYVGRTNSIVLYDGRWNGHALGTNYTVSNLGVEGVDWELVEVVGTQTMDPHTVTLNILTSHRPVGYDYWPGDYGLTGSDADRGYDYDGDGAVNFYEYAFGGDPTNELVTSYAFEGYPVVDGGTTYMEYVYPRRKDYLGVLDYEAQFGSNLVITNWSASGVVELPVAGEIDPYYESVTNRVDITSKPVGFMQTVVDEL